MAPPGVVKCVTCTTLHGSPRRSFHVTDTMLQGRLHVYHTYSAVGAAKRGIFGTLQRLCSWQVAALRLRHWNLGLGHQATPSFIPRGYCFSPKEAGTAQRQLFRNAFSHQLVINEECPLTGFYTTCERHLRNGSSSD